MTFRFSRTWAVRWHEHLIEVENWWTPVLWCGEALRIDGRVVDRHTGWGRIASRLTGDIPDESGCHIVQARLSAVDHGFGTGCHILVDDRPVGGDLHKKLLR